MTTAAEPVPAWLSAWRQRHAAQAPALVPEPPPPAPTPARSPRPPLVSRGVSQGFTEPRQWPDDGARRREPVLDNDHRPPRVVRRVGWCSCLRCRRSFFSQDVVRQRLCGDCRADADRYA